MSFIHIHKKLLLDFNVWKKKIPIYQVMLKIESIDALADGIVVGTQLLTLDPLDFQPKIVQSKA